MNKTYKKVFNARRGKYVAVDETKTGHGQMGTCTVGGAKPAAITAAVVGAVLAMGTSGALASNDLTITTQTENATTEAGYSIPVSVSEANNLTVSGSGGVEWTVSWKWKRYSSTPDWLATTETETFATRAEAEAHYSQWRVDNSNRYLVADPTYTDKTIPGAEVTATNSSILKVSGLTKLASEATLVNTGTITSEAGLSIDATSKLVNTSTGKFTTEKNGSFANVTGNGTIDNAGTLTVGAISASEIINTKSITAKGNVVVDKLTNTSGSLTVTSGGLSIGGTDVADDSSNTAFISVAKGTISVSGRSDKVKGEGILEWNTVHNKNSLTNSGEVEAKNLQVKHSIGSELLLDLLGGKTITHDHTSSFVNEAFDVENEKGESIANARFESVLVEASKIVNRGWIDVSGTTTLQGETGVDMLGSLLENEEGATFETGNLIVNSSSALVKSQVNNQGTFLVHGNLTNNGIFNNGSNVASADNSGVKTTIEGSFENQSRGELNNFGTFEVTGEDVVSNNAGTISNAGTFDVAGSLTNTGSINNTKDFIVDGTFTNDGTFVNGTEGAVSLTVNTQVGQLTGTDTDSILKNFGTFEVTGEDVVSNNAGTVTNAGKFDVAGDLSNTGSITNTKDFIVDGAFTNDGTFVNGTEGAVDLTVNTQVGQLTGSADKTAAQLNNYGSFNVTGTAESKNFGTITNEGHFNVVGSLTNEDDATIENKGVFVVGTFNEDYTQFIDPETNIFDTSKRGKLTVDQESNLLNEGDINNEGTLLVSGDFTNKGSLTTSGVTTIYGDFESLAQNQASVTVKEGGDLYAFGDLEATGAVTIETGGKMDAHGSVTIEKADITVSGEAKIRESLSVANINVTSGGKLDVTNGAVASDKTTIDGDSLMSAGTLTSGQIDIESGKLTVGDKITVTGNSIINKGEISGVDVTGPDITGTSAHLQNLGGQLTANNVHVNQFTNKSDKLVNINGDLTVNGALNNQAGKIEIAGNGDATTPSLSAGSLSNAGDIEVQAGNASITNGLTNTAGSFTVTSGHLSAGSIDIQVGKLDVAAGNIVVTGDSFKNAGEVVTKDITGTSAHLQNTGKLTANNVHVNQFTNNKDKLVDINGDLTVNGALDNQAGKIEIAGNGDPLTPSLSAGSLSNAGDIHVQAGNTSITNGLTNTAGSITVTNGDLSAGSIDIEAGKLTVGGDIAVSGNSIINKGEISGADITGTSAHLQNTGKLTATNVHVNQFTNNTDKLVDINGDLTVNGDLDNQAGKIEIAGNGDATTPSLSAGSLSNAGDIEVQAGNASITNDLTNTKGSITVTQGSLSAGSVDIQAGKLTVGGDLTVGGSWDANGKLVDAVGSITNKGSISTERLDGTFGSVNAGSLDNFGFLDVGSVVVDSFQNGNVTTRSENEGTVSNVHGDLTVRDELKNNSGTLNVIGGNLNFGTSGQYNEMTNDGNINITAGAEGTGALNITGSSKEAVSYQDLLNAFLESGGFGDKTVSDLVGWNVPLIGGAKVDKLLGDFDLSDRGNLQTGDDHKSTLVTNSGHISADSLNINHSFSGLGQDSDPTTFENLGTANFGSVTLDGGKIDNAGSIVVDGTTELKNGKGTTLGFNFGELIGYENDKLKFEYTTEGSGSTLVNQSGHRYETGGLIVRDKSSVSNDGDLIVNGDVINAGSITNNHFMDVSGNFENSGTLTNNGQLDVDGYFHSTGTVINGTDKVINVGQDFWIKSGSLDNMGTINAKGDITIDGNIINAGKLNGEGSVTANIVYNFGSVDYGAGNMNFSGLINGKDNHDQTYVGSEFLLGGNLTVNGSILNTSDSLIQIGGNVQSNQITNEDGSIIIGGSLTNSGNVTNQGFMQVGTLGANSKLDVDGVVTNAGSFVVNGSVSADTIQNSGIFNANGDVELDYLNNTTDNFFVALDGAEANYNFTANNLTVKEELLNAGNIHVDGKTDISGGSLSNSGLLDTGSLVVGNGVTGGSVVNTGTLNADSLDITAGITGSLPSVENQNKIDVGVGTMIGGSLTNKEGATAEFDSLIVTGTALGDASVNNSGDLTINGGSKLPGVVGTALNEALGTALGSSLNEMLDGNVEFGLVQANLTGSSSITNNASGSMTVNGLSVNISGSIANEGNMTFNDTLIAVGGSITNDGTLKTEGSLDVSSLVQNIPVLGGNMPSGLANMDVGYVQVGSTSITNTNTWISSGALLMGGTVNNGTEDDKNATTTMNGLTIVAGSTINNHGTLNTTGSLDITGFIPAELEQYIPAGMDQIDVGYLQFSGELNNEGTWNSSSVVIAGGEVNNSGTIQIGKVGSTTEGHMLVLGGQLNNDVNGELTLTGTMFNASDIVNDGTLNTTGGVDVTGVLSNLVPNFTVPSGMTDIDVGYVQIGGSLTNNNDWNASSIVVAGGTVNNNAELSAGHTIIVGGTFNNGSMNDDGTVNGASASMSGATIVAGGTVNNFGDLSTKGGVDLTGFIPAELEAYLPDSLETVSLGYAQLGGTVNNSGTWDSSSAVVLGGTINNNDTFNIGSNIEAGHLLIGGSAQLNNAEGAVTNVAGTMVVVGTSGVDTVVNNGTMNTTGGIELGGVINKIAPNLNLPDSITNIDIGYVQLGGNVVNNAEWNASSMVIAGGSFVNGDELNAGHAVIFGELTNNADATVNMTGTTIVAGGSIVNNGQLNTTGGIEVGGVVESLTNGSVELPAGLNSIDVGYAQIGGTTTNNNEWNASSVVNVGGSIVNDGQFNADHMVSVDGTLTNAKDKTVELTGTMVNIATSTDKVVLDNAGSLKTEGSVNLNGLAIGEFELPESLANVELGYAQVGGTANNTGDWDVNNALVVGGVINNANELNADKLFAYGSTITNTGNLTANWIAAAGEGQITNGNKLDVDVMGVVGTGFENQEGAEATIDSMLAINSTVVNDGTLTTVTGVQMPDEVQAGVEQLAAQLGVDISGLDLDQHVELGYVQVGGTMQNNKDWDASNMVAVGGTINNAGDLNADKIFAFGSTIENSDELTANWIAAAGEGQITNADGGKLDVDVMGVVGTGFENQEGAEATIDSMLAINSTVVNDGTLTTVTGVQLPDAVQDGIVALADKLGVDISGLDLDQHAELGYTQVGGSMENNGQWTASNMVAVGGSITNNNSLTTDGIYSVDTDIANNGQLDINGHLVMIDVNPDTAMSNLTNAADKTMTVTGAMTLVGVNMVNKGTLNTGDSTIDGAGSVASELHNLGTWNSTNLGMAGGDLVNEGADSKLNVSGLMTVAGGSVTNEGTMNTTGKVAVDGLDIDVGYLQAAGSMINEGQWNASQIVAFGGTITNMESGVMNNTGMTLVDTDVKNVGQMKVDGHFVMSEVESGDYTKLTNTGTMTVTGAMGLAGVNMVNTGILTTGDGSIDGTAAVASTMLNKGTWNSTNIGILAGDLDNEGSINVTKQMLIAGGDVNNAVNGTITVDGVFGITSGTLNNNGMLNTGDGVIDGTAALDATLNNNEGATWNATNLGLVLGTLNNAGDLNVTKSVSVAGGTFDNVADVTVGEHMLVAGGDVNNAVNGTITVDGVFGITGGTLNNNGLLETGDGVIDGTVALGATLNNNEGATWNATNLSVALGDLNNEGSINVTKQMLIAGGDVNNAVDATITVDGVFGITSGMLNNNGMLNTGDGVIDGTAAAGAILNNNGTWNASNIGVALGTLTNDDTIKTTGHVTLAGGLITNNADATMTVGGVLGITAGVLTNNGTLVTGNGALDGAVGALAYLNNNGTWNATNLGIGYGVLTNKGTLTASGTTYVGEGGLMINAGEFTSKILGVAEDGQFVNNGEASFGPILSTAETTSVDFIVEGKAINNGELSIKDTAVVSGFMDNNAKAEFNADTLYVDGTFNNNTGALANIGKDLGVSGTVNNSGILTVDGTAAVAKDATLNNQRGFEADKLGVSGTLNNWGGIHTTTQAFVEGTVNLNAGSQWLVEGNGIGNTGSITGLGSMTLNGSVAINTKDSTFEVGQLNLKNNAALYHGAEAGSDFSGLWAGAYTAEALDKLKTLAGIEVTQAKAKIADSEFDVGVLTNTNTKDQLVIGKTLNVNGLNVGGTLSSSMQDIAHFGEKSAVIIDVQSLGTDYAFNSEGSKLVVDQGAALILNGVGHGGRYNIAQNFDLSATGPNSGWTGNSLYAPETSGTGLNWVLDLTWDKLVGEVGNVYVDATLESVGDNKLYNAGGWNVIHKNIVDEVLRTALADNQASTMSLRETTVVGSDGFTNKMYGDLFMNRYLDATTKVLVSNSLASVAQNIGVESLALDNVTDTMKGIEDHASMVGTMPVANGSNLWAQVLGTEHKQDGMKSSGGAKLGYDADDRGFMIGYDIVNGAMNARYGFAMSYLDGSVSSVGDHLATTGDYNTFGLHGYMNWAPAENVNVIATVGYSRGNAEASMNLPKLAGWDSYGKATADVDTNIFSAGIRAETSIKVNNVNIVPHAGLRVMAIDVNGYDTKIDGTTAFHNNADTAVIGQLPFGVTVKGEFETNGWNVKPMADVTFVPQFGETKSQTTTTFPGGTASDVNVAEFTGNFSTNFTFGVEAQKGDYSVGMELGVTKGQNNKTDSSFMAKVRYQF